MSTNSANLIRLFFGQFFAYIHAPSLIFTIPIIGYTLAPNKNLAALPIALLTVLMVFSIPFINQFMKKRGRTLGYMLGAFLIIVSSIGIFLSLMFHSFTGLCIATSISGISGAFTHSYRFAVLEFSTVQKSGRNVSYLLLGGVFGGFSGPFLVNFFVDGIKSEPFAASFLALAGIGSISMIVLSGLKFTKVSSEEEQTNPSKSFKINPNFLACAICGAMTYGLMSLIMTATPVVMHHHHHFSLPETAFVIQSHVVAMFLPSLFSGILIDRFGGKTVMYAGALILLTCSITALSGVFLVNFWFALVCLGVGWNFLFVGSTVAVNSTYQPNQRFEAQSINDFIVFSINALGALSSAWLLNLIGWGSMQILAIILLGLILFLIQFTKIKVVSRKPS